MPATTSMEYKIVRDFTTAVCMNLPVSVMNLA